MKRLNIRNIAMMGVLIALDVVATRFLGFSTLTIRISFGSVFIILAGLWFGPLEGALVGGIGDMIGCLIAGTGFYPPLMLSPILFGTLIGLLRPVAVKKPSIFKVGTVITFANIVTTLFLTTWGLSLLYGTSFQALFVSRIPQFIVNTAVCTALSYGIYRSAVTRVATGCVQTV